MITIGSLFDGISGFPLAGQRNGMTALWSSEIKPFPMKVSAIRFPDMKQMGDITKIDCNSLEPVDIVTGGSPCQDLSVAGKRAGLAGARSGLFMEQIRIVRELREIDKTNGRTGNTVRPRFMLWENVPGAFSSNKGEDFRAVLEETARIADETATIPRPPKDKWNTAGCIMGDGWSIAWRVLDAQYWGVPQRRRRIFLVADFGGQSAPEVLFKREGLRRHIAESGEAREGTASDVERGVGKAKCYDIGEARLRTPSEYEELTPTLSARMGTGGNNVPAVIPINDKATRHMGGGASRNHDGSGNGLGVDKPGDPCPTLTQGDKHAVCAGFNGYKSVSGSIQYQEEKAATLEANMPGNVINCQPSGIVGTYQKVTGPLMANTHPGSYSGQDAYSDMLVAQPFPSGVAHCLSRQPQLRHRDDMDNLVVAGLDIRNLKENGDISGTLQAKKTGGYSLNYTHPIRRQYSVRRLTPLECERLQGFPDGWTDISGQTEATKEELEFWREVWFTWDKTQAENPEKVKPRTDKAILKWLKNPTSDSAQYKALGNSVAVPCPEYVLEGIKEVLEDTNETSS